MTAEPLRVDRRHRRREETRREVVDIAVELMAEQGAGGLSLGEVARRMGIRTPSLYVYFPSKHALYDAVFERGWTELLDVLVAHGARAEVAEDLEPLLLGFAREFVGWFLANPAFAPLMMWRPIPGYEPSEQAYRPAVEVLDRSLAVFVRLSERGLLRADVDPADALRVWTVVTSGVATQQMSNEPDATLDSGRFVAALPDVVAMYTAHYGARPPRRPNRRTSRGDSRRPDR